MTLTWWKQNKYRSCDGIICDGSVRSGKTVCMALSFVLWSMERFENQRFALCGKTIESLRRNVTGLLPQWLEGICQIEERRSENRLTISMNGRRNDYYLFGGKDEGSYALIQGMTLSGVLFDEVALMPRSFVEQALARCSVEGSKFFFNCNPEGPEHWFYKSWVLRARERNLLYLHFTMGDNPALSSAIRRRYERLYSGVFYQRYVQGLWVPPLAAGQGQKVVLREGVLLVRPGADAAEDGRRVCRRFGAVFGGSQAQSNYRRSLGSQLYRPAAAAGLGYFGSGQSGAHRHPQGGAALTGGQAAV